MESGDAVARLTEGLSTPEIGLGPDAAVAVAWSGGIDSSVLLHAMLRLVNVARVRALHIDHGLHPDSQQWAAHCRATAARLSVALVERRVEVARRPAQSLEDAARRARYSALAELIEPGEILLTAHHGEDQLETLLFRLLRGTGIRGLRGIAEREPFGRGMLARPFLELTRRDIACVAELWGLRWIEDPSNQALRHDRNYIRERLVPAALARWPQAPHAARRLARAARDAEESLTALAEHDLAASGAPHRLSLAPLRGLSPARQRNVLRHAVGLLGLPVPDSRRLEQVRRLIDAAAAGCVQWRGAEARRYRARLYLHAAAPLTGSCGPAAVLRLDEPLALDQGWLTLERSSEAAGLPAAWADAGLQVAYRCGGERFQAAGEARNRPLSEWFRAHGIVPWQRDRVPLLVYDGAIVAIADLAIADRALRNADSGARWRVVWHDRPCLA